MKNVLGICFLLLPLIANGLTWDNLPSKNYGNEFKVCTPSDIDPEIEALHIGEIKAPNNETDAWYKSREQLIDATCLSVYVSIVSYESGFEHFRVGIVASLNLDGCIPPPPRKPGQCDPDTMMITKSLYTIDITKEDEAGYFTGKSFDEIFLYNQKENTITFLVNKKVYKYELPSTFRKEAKKPLDTH